MDNYFAVEPRVLRITQHCYWFHTCNTGNVLMRPEHFLALNNKMLSGVGQQCTLVWVWLTALFLMQEILLGVIQFIGTLGKNQIRNLAFLTLARILSAGGMQFQWKLYQSPSTVEELKLHSTQSKITDSLTNSFVDRILCRFISISTRANYAQLKFICMNASISLKEDIS